ncbi:MAG: hypothetical protein WCB44_19255, partial [Stellaceae bacterium]
MRAVASLARQWREQRRCEESRDLLSPVYGWFIEGVEMPDLKATALITQLERSRAGLDRTCGRKSRSTAAGAAPDEDRLTYVNTAVLPPRPVGGPRVFI